MGKVFRKSLLAAAARVVLLGLLAAVLSCQSEEARVAQMIERGEAAREAEQWDAAILHFRNALKTDPNQLPAHSGLATLYLRKKRIVDASWEFSEVIRLDPQNAEARQALGELALMRGEPEEAALQAAALLEIEPTSVEGRLVMGQALELMGKPESARAAFEEALSLRPDGVGVLWLLGSFHQRRGDPEIAESLLTKWTQLQPTARSHTALAQLYRGLPDRDLDAEAAYRAAIETAAPEERAEGYRALANFLYVVGRTGDAEKVLEEGIESGVEGALDLTLVLAVFYGLQGDTKKEAETLERATRDHPDQLQAYLTLSDLRGRNGDPEGALDAAERALAVDPSSVPATLRKAEVLVDLSVVEKSPDSLVESRSLVEGVLAKNASDPRAVLVLGKVELIEGNVAAAVQRLEQVIEVTPESAEAHSVLALAYVEQQELTRARGELVQALRIDPARFHLRRVLSRVAASLGEDELAVVQGTRYLRQQPADREIQSLVVHSLIRLGRRDQARQRLEAQTERQPNATASFTLGRMAFTDGQLEEAWGHLVRANELAPYRSDVLSALLAVERARSGSMTESVERIQAAVQAQPTNAQLVQLQANVALLEGDVDRAEQGYQRAIQLDPRDFSAYDALARLFVLTGRSSPAIAAFEKALVQEPDKAAIHHVLGVLYASEGRSTLAMEHFEAAVKNDPELASSKNNLAYLYAESDANLDRALELAREAKAQLPEHAHAADTLGWVLHKLGVPTAAIAYLREAEAGIDPTGPEIAVVSHHLAQAYEANDQAEDALATLDHRIASIEQQFAALADGDKPEGLHAPAQLYEMRDRLASAQAESAEESRR